MPMLDPMAREKFRRGSVVLGGRRRASMDTSMNSGYVPTGLNQHPYNAPLSPPRVATRARSINRTANNNSMSRRPSALLTGFAQKLAALSPDKSPRRSTLPTLHELPSDSRQYASSVSPDNTLKAQQGATIYDKHENHTGTATTAFDFDNCISTAPIDEAAAGANFIQELR